MANSEVHSIHHINFPTTNPQRTADWYGKVFGVEGVNVSQWTPDTQTVLLTKGNFDLHFTPTTESPTVPCHFAIEVEDWDGFLEHLDNLGVEYDGLITRPQNNSKAAFVRDPDGHEVEITWHGDRDW